MITVNMAFPTGPKPASCTGRRRSLPSWPMRPTGATTTAVPTPKDSRILPCAERVVISDMARMRSCVCSFCEAGMPGRSSFPEVWAFARVSVESRVRPGRMVPSSGGVMMSKSVDDFWFGCLSRKGKGRRTSIISMCNEEKVHCSYFCYSLVVPK